MKKAAEKPIHRAFVIALVMCGQGVEAYSVIHIQLQEPQHHREGKKPEKPHGKPHHHHDHGTRHKLIEERAAAAREMVIETNGGKGQRHVSRQPIKTRRKKFTKWLTNLRSNNIG